MKGKIISSLRGTYKVYVDGIVYSVFPKGNLKFKNKHLVVGDEVILDDENFMILDVLDRKNELIRPKASNIDQLLIVMSVVEPDLSLELVYKFLTYANMNDIPSMVALTKMDKVKNPQEVASLRQNLEKMGIKVFYISRDENSEITTLKEQLASKTTVIMGQTGVGKSSLINSIDENFARSIGEYSTALGRGKHQTKEVILLPYLGGFLGDTPGFSSLELNIFKEDLATYFPGYNDFYLECYFSDCLHRNEKECKVKEKINEGILSSDAHNAYLKLLNELPYKKERFKK